MIRDYRGITSRISFVGLIDGVPRPMCWLGVLSSGTKIEEDGNGSLAANPGPVELHEVHITAADMRTLGAEVLKLADIVDTQAKLMGLDDPEAAPESTAEAP